MSSFGPINRKHPKFGECLYCWDENFARQHHMFIEPRQIMRGPVCGHRLLPPKSTWKQFKINARDNKRRDEINAGVIDHLSECMGECGKATYWRLRVLLPEFCGEFGELSDLRLAGLSHMKSEEVEALLAKIYAPI